MTDTNLFERATRQKLRFTTISGQFSTEDLWDLPLTSRKGPSLDDIAKDHNLQLKESAEESFVTKASKANTLIQLKFDVVLHVINVKLAEKEAAEIRETLRQKKAKIEGIIAKKGDEALESASVEELQEMLKEVG